MTRLWTNGSDYVIAESAEAALKHAMEASDLSEDDLGSVEEWRTVPEERVLTLRDEDGRAVENVSVCAILARHTLEVPFYWWSSEW